MDKIIKIKELVKKLEDQLQDPQIYNNQEKLKSISQEYNQSKKILTKLLEIKDIDEKIKKTEEILSSSDFEQDMIELAKIEIDELVKEKNKITKQINKGSQEESDMDNKNIIMEIRAGTGGGEAALFAANLFRMYSRFAEKMAWKTKIISSNKTSIKGFKEVIFEINGTNVFSLLKNESGIHRVQRVPDTEKNNRLHTSAASVAVLPKANKIDVKIDPKDLKTDLFKASGHGGQNVQKNETAVRITHIPTNIIVSCQDERSQKQNKEKAMIMLCSKLLALKEEQRLAKIKEKRSSQVKSGDRSEKIRTYNFPQDRVTDHRIKKSWHGIENILDGEISPIIKAMTND
ncbi:peptide chain release factor 1 [Patescibacteria group bacterium]|nr:peptide chain release factor 1 [Patescibacteria group bacterium]